MSTGFLQSVVQALTARSTTQRQELGAIFWVGSKAYKYVKMNHNSITDAVQGDVVFVDNEAMTEVTADVSASIVATGFAAGVLEAALGDGEYGWIQVKGVSRVLNTDIGGSVAIGAAITGGGASDKAFQIVGAVNAPFCGVVLNATTTTHKVYLECPL